MEPSCDTKMGNRPDHSYICPECGSSNILTQDSELKFTYGTGESAIELSARVPVRICSDCGIQFTDSVADDKCHEEICRYLGVMSPAQVRSLRELYNLSQAEFSHITKLGEATLSRWERGVVIQNQAYDNYLYLLGYSENLERVESRKKLKGSDSHAPKSVFREIEITSELLEQQRLFKLVAV